MNYILNNKMKIEKNRYNKPVLPRTPIVLKNTPFIKVPLKLDTRLDTYPNISNSEYSTNNIIDFKLKNYKMKEFISNEQIHFQYEKHNQIEPITKPIEPYYNDELIINIYGYASINDNSLYNFLLDLSSKFKIRIYIYTYNLNLTTIEYYFQGLNVVSIIIDEKINIDSTESIDSSKNIFSKLDLLYFSMLIFVFKKFFKIVLCLQ